MKRLTFGTIASLMFIAFLRTANTQLVFTNATGDVRLIAQHKFP